MALSTSAFSASVQQQALILLVLAFAADMVVGALLVPLHILLQVGFGCPKPILAHSNNLCTPPREKSVQIFIESHQ